MTTHYGPIRDAAAAEEVDPLLLVVYWSADYIDREIARLERDYTQFRNHLHVCYPPRNPRGRSR